MTVNIATVFYEHNIEVSEKELLKRKIKGQIA